MAEIIEINLVCNNKLDTKILLSIINSNAKGNIESRTIEIMDNWEYENKISINSEEDVADLIEDKIICITEKYSSGYAGLNIESVHQRYCYTIWFNSANYDDTNQYSNLIKKFISQCKEIFCNNCVLCSVGKEVIFEYEYDCYKTIYNSHNIDVWIILSDEYDSVIKHDVNIFSRYSVCTQGDFVVLYKNHDLFCDN